MSVNIENIVSCPRCKARLLVFTYEGPDQYLSCVKCSWKILAEKKAGVSKVAKVKKKTPQVAEKLKNTEPKPDQRDVHYDYISGSQALSHVFYFVRCTNLRRCEKLTHVFKSTNKCPWCNKLGQLEQVSLKDFTSKHHEAYNRKVGILSEREQHLFRPVLQLIIVLGIGFGVFSMCTNDRSHYGGALDNPAFDAR